MEIKEFLNKHKYKILIVLLIIFLWRILSQNFMLLILIACIAYFIYSEKN